MEGFVEILYNWEVRKIPVFTLLVWLSIPLMILPQLDGKLLGDHICQTDIWVPQEVLKWELKNRTIRTYKWCMSVPPRCSVYSNKILNETRISVINITKATETCCEGFKEQNNFCVSQCQRCQNGLCMKGTCVCQIGWDGPECDTRTTSTTTDYAFIEPNTATHDFRELSTIDADAVTPSTSISSTFKPSSASFEENVSTRKSFSTLDGEITRNAIADERNSTTSKTNSEDYSNSLETYSTLLNPITTSKSIHLSAKNYTMSPPIRHPLLEQMLILYKAYVSTSTEDPNIAEDLEGSGARYRSKLEESSSHLYTTDAPSFDTTVTQQMFVSSTAFVEDKERFDSNEEVNSFENKAPTFEREESSNDYRELEKDIFEEAFAKNTLKEISKGMGGNNVPGFNAHLESTEVLAKSSSFEDRQEENAILKENLLRNINDFIGERFEKRSSMENLNQNSKMTINEATSKSLIYSICAASLTTFLILVIVVTLYAVRNSRKKVEKSKAKKDLGTVAVYTTSIFHSPLPDPPTFDNPAYLATGINGSNWNQSKRESIEIQEFNVVFQKPIKNPTLDCKQYLYDHPPSTGSYRASSEVDTLSQYNFSQKSLPGIVVEPLYDEIPVKDARTQDDKASHFDVERSKGNIDPNCLYMNTCGRTKF